MGEQIWRDVPGYHPYQASNLGNIRNSKTGKILKQHASYSREYYRVPSLVRDGKQYTAEVHRLVAMAFFGEPPTDTNGLTYFVNHKDGNKQNNHIENLEYITSGENTVHYHEVVRPMALQRIAESFGLTNWRQVEQAIIRGEIELKWKQE